MPYVAQRPLTEPFLAIQSLMKLIRSVTGQVSFQGIGKSPCRPSYLSGIRPVQSVRHPPGSYRGGRQEAGTGAASAPVRRSLGEGASARHGGIQDGGGLRAENGW